MSIVRMLMLPGLSLLLILVVPPSATQELTPFKETFDILLTELLPCGGGCAIEHLNKTVSAGLKCTEPVVDTITNTQITTYQDFFSEFIVGGKLCSLYKTTGGCYKKEMESVCGSFIGNLMQELMDQNEATICSTNPNYMKCVLDPAILGLDQSPSSQLTPALQCAVTLSNAWIGVDINNVYNDLIIKDNGVSLFSSLDAFAVCFATEVKKVADCDVAGDRIEKYMKEMFDYFDFGAGGKDYLKCFIKDSLITGMLNCGGPFVNSLTAVNPDVLKAFSEDPMQYKSAWTTFSGCIKQMMDSVCASEPDSIEITKTILKPLDNFYGVSNDGPDKCAAAGCTSYPCAGCASFRFSFLILVTSLMMSALLYN